MAARPLSGRKNAGRCYECQEPRAPGRVKYCGDTCASAARAKHRQGKLDSRVQGCARCGAAKERGTRGARYCTECRRLMADRSEQAEFERGRRKQLRKVAERLAAGERIAMRTLECPPGFKWCARCQDYRPQTSFPTRSDTKKSAAYCRPCQRAYNRERRIKLEFGLTYDEYEMLLACQDFRCAICQGKPRKYDLAVDHDHKTGEIRGLLCSRCNHRLLGAAADSAERLRRAARYLEEFTPREVFGRAKFVPGSTPESAT